MKKLILLSIFMAFLTNPLLSLAADNNLVGRTGWDFAAEVFKAMIGEVKIYRDKKIIKAAIKKNKNEKSRNYILSDTINKKEPKWCNDANSPSERFICSNVEVWPFENENSRIYSLIYIDKKSKQNNIDELKAWIRYRNSICVKEIELNQCLLVYQERIETLKERLSIKKGKIPSNAGSRPEWCSSNKLNQAEKIICKDEKIWFYDNTARFFYHEKVKNSSLPLKNRLKNHRHPACIRSTFHCAVAYHEDIFHLSYELSLK